MKMLTIFNFTEDGVTARQMTKDVFLKRLNDEDYGDEPYFFSKKDVEAINGYSWPLGLLILDGEIVSPKPETKVTKFVL